MGAGLGVNNGEGRTTPNRPARYTAPSFAAQVQVRDAYGNQTGRFSGSACSKQRLGPMTSGRTAVGRSRRPHGMATQADIIETAGHLFAQHGYSGTTGKAISERAGVNAAMVNYHFGNLDGLYLAVLRTVQQRIISMEFLDELSKSHQPAEEKLRLFFRTMVGRALEHADDTWPIRVWAREILSPSPILELAMDEAVDRKYAALVRIVSEVSGMQPSDARMPGIIVSVVAPCLIMLIADPSTKTPIQPVFAEAPAELADLYCTFALSGLKALTPRPRRLAK